MQKYNWKDWVKAAGIRAIRSIAQTATAMLGTNAMTQAMDWKMIVTTSLLAGLVSLLTSINGLPELDAEPKDR